uniref:Uncharacterized protein n=1 Tax=Oryza nivara TaxID=4536 RepID=A0A0E0IS34_ORYNI
MLYNVYIYGINLRLSTGEKGCTIEDQHAVNQILELEAGGQDQTKNKGATNGGIEQTLLPKNASKAQSRIDAINPFAMTHESNHGPA